MKIKEVINYLDSLFHPEYQEDYDNSGYLLGCGDCEYKGTLVALDLTEAVVDEALAAGDVNLIVTHHPFIFSGLKRLTDNNTSGRLVWKLIKNDMAVYAAHTNLDNLPWGVSGILAQKLGLRNTRVLHNYECRNSNSEEVSYPNSQFIIHNSQLEIGAGMVGELPEPMTLEAFLLKVKAVTGIPFIRISQSLIPNPSFPIKRVALCGGSGAPFIHDAIDAKADIYLTGDLKYHDFQRTDGRMVLADIGHYESEQFAREIIFNVIFEKFSTFACRISEKQKSIIQYI